MAGNLLRGHAALYLSIFGVLLMVAAVSAISARDTSGVGVRAGMILLTAGASLLLPWQLVLPAVLACWFGPNAVRSAVDGYELFNTEMLLELPGLLGLGIFCVFLRRSAQLIEHEAGLAAITFGDVDQDTGVYEERGLEKAVEAELSRARRFGRGLAVVLVGVDTLHQRFDYRDALQWKASFKATAALLKGTRNNIDRVYRYGASGFALVLPESGPKEVEGMVKRLRRDARARRPREGEPGGPLPTSFGASFYPAGATTVQDLLRRAEVALRLAVKNSNRLQLDGAEAPPGPPPESLRREGSVQAGPAEAPTPEPATATISLEQAGAEETSAAGAVPDLGEMVRRMDDTLELLRGLRGREAS